METVLAQAKQILISCCDDTMTPFQKMYNVYYYLQSHVAYDIAGEEWAGRSPDPEDEAGFDRYMEKFIACIPAQQAAVDGLKI